MSPRAWFVIPLVLLSLGALGGAAWWWMSEPAPPARSARHDRDRDDRKSNLGPMLDPFSNAPVDPPPRERGHIAPTAPDAPHPSRAVTPVARPATPPNVVLILGCTIRKDQLSTYGGFPGTTPTLDKLAAAGVRFDDVIAAAPWTRAASIAIETGRHAVAIGAVEPGSGRDDSVIPDDVVTLAEHLSAAGWLTIGTTGNPNLSSAFGFSQGFDAYQPGLREDDWTTKLPANRLARAMIDELRHRREAGDERPVFLRTMLIDAHAPRDADGPDLEPWAEDRVPARVAQYRVHLNRLDRAIQHYLTELSTIGMDASNTVFVFVGDHGEGMNYPSHHGLGHGQYFGSSTVHVPWIMAGPGIAAGQVVYGTASQVDLVPTLLGTLGVQVADLATDGLDLSGLVRGEGDVITRAHVISDTWFAAASRAAIFTPWFVCQLEFGSGMRQQKKGKFLPGCFDRHADPLSEHALSESSTQWSRVFPLVRTLEVWRAQHKAQLDALTPERARVSDDLAKGLEQLGYVDRTAEAP